MKAHWENILKDRLQLYGHRNWLVIADSAYPAQSKQGIETLVVNEEQTHVLEETIAILQACKHVTATVYTDKELTFVSERDAKGSTGYRRQLGSLLRQYQVQAIPHETMISRLDSVGEQFQVLLIKTNMRIPYTTVFFELGCGYWDEKAEMRLRAAMRSRNGHGNILKRREKN